MSVPLMDDAANNLTLASMMTSETSMATGLLDENRSKQRLAQLKQLSERLWSLQ